MECAFTSPVRTEWGMFAMYCMQWFMCQLFCSACIYMFAIVICLVLLMCTLTI